MVGPAGVNRAKRVVTMALSIETGDGERIIEWIVSDFTGGGSPSRAKGVPGKERVSEVETYSFNNERLRGTNGEESSDLDSHCD